MLQRSGSSCILTLSARRYKQVFLNHAIPAGMPTGNVGRAVRAFRLPASSRHALPEKADIE